MVVLPPYESSTYTEFLYDGELKVIEGRVEIPRGRNEWAGRLLQLGYAWADGVVPSDFEPVR
jgi:hypothetical protein